MIEQRQSTAPPGFRSFEFDLPSALLRQLAAVLDEMEQGCLLPEITQAIPNGQGVYQLFHHGRLVYIGKTDGEAGLRQRLSRHAWTIQSRHNLEVAEMSFKAVQVLVFSAMDLESALIKHYRKRKQPPVWNGSGFGSNDPGRRRDTTALKTDGFDALYPINVDLPLEDLSPGDRTPLEVLTQLIPRVPYTVRHERTESALAELSAVKVSLTNENARTLRSAFKTLCAVLPPGWQVTRLPGRVIMYREDVDTYPGGEILAQS